MSDALERFAVSINQARAVQSAEDAQLIIDRLITPKTAKKEAAASVVPADQRQTPMYDPNDRFKEDAQAQQNGGSLYSFDDQPQPESMPAAKPAPVQARPPAKPMKKKPAQNNVNISSQQIAIIVGVFAVLVICLLILIAVGFYLNAG